MTTNIKDITLFITACNRPDLLKITIETFQKYNTYPIKEAIIIEDSGLQGIIDIAKDILNFPTTLLYNERQMGQMPSIERGVKLIKTPYVFHCEEDWEFYDYGFIEKSLEILEKDPLVVTVFLRSFEEYCNRYGFSLNATKKDGYYYVQQLDQPGKEWAGTLTFNPGLRTIEIAKAYMPYTGWQDEGTIALQFLRRGLHGAATDNANGYVRHIGWERHTRGGQYVQ